LAQRYPSVEILVVDDGSDNSGLQVARRYEPFVRIVEVPKRINPGAERSIALAHAVGDFVVFQDCEDIQFPDRIGQDVETARRSRADLVVSGDLLRVGDTLKASLRLRSPATVTKPAPPSIFTNRSLPFCAPMACSFSLRVR